MNRSMTTLVGAAVALVMGGAMSRPADATGEHGAGDTTVAPSKYGMAKGVTSLHDARGDSAAGIDISSGRFTRYSTGKVKATVFFYDFSTKLNAIQVYFSTSTSHPGPEYTAYAFRSKDGDGLSDVRMFRTSGFGVLGARVRDCSWSYKYDNRFPAGHQYFKMVLGKACFQGHSDHPIKAQARAWNFTRYNSHGWPTKGLFDNLVGPRTFTSFF